MKTSGRGYKVWFFDPLTGVWEEQEGYTSLAVVLRIVLSYVDALTDPWPHNKFRVQEFKRANDKSGWSPTGFGFRGD